jgi:hypothetical protein
MSDCVDRVDKAAREYAKDYSDWPVSIRIMLVSAFVNGAAFGLGEAREIMGRHTESEAGE